MKGSNFEISGKLSLQQREVLLKQTIYSPLNHTAYSEDNQNISERKRTSILKLKSPAKGH